MPEKARYRRSGTMAGQFQPESGIHPFGWKPRARQRFSAGKTSICSSRTSGSVSSQVGYAPVRLEAHGQTAVQCRQSDSSQQQNSSRAVSNQIGHAHARLEASTTESRKVGVSDTSHLTRPTEIRNSLGLVNPAADRAVPCQKKRDIAAAERWRGSFNPNRAYARSVGSPGPDSGYVQAKREFAGAEL